MPLHPVSAYEAGDVSRGCHGKWRLLRFYGGRD